MEPLRLIKVTECEGDPESHLHLTVDETFDICIAGIKGQTSAVYLVELLGCLGLVDQEGKNQIYESAPFATLSRKEVVVGDILDIVRDDFMTAFLRLAHMATLAMVGNPVMLLPVEKVGKGIGRYARGAVLVDHYGHISWVESLYDLRQCLAEISALEADGTVPENFLTTPEVRRRLLQQALAFGLPAFRSAPQSLGWKFHYWRSLDMPIGKNIFGYRLERPDRTVVVGFSRQSALSAISFTEPLTMIVDERIPQIQSMVMERLELPPLDSLPPLEVVELPLGLKAIVQRENHEVVRSALLNVAGELIVEWDYVYGKFKPTYDELLGPLAVFHTGKPVSVESVEEHALRLMSGPVLLPAVYDNRLGTAPTAPRPPAAADAEAEASEEVQRVIAFGAESDEEEWTDGLLPPETDGGGSGPGELS